MIDVSKFGAGGDGTDQTAQIRTAMNSAQKGGSGLLSNGSVQDQR